MLKNREFVYKHRHFKKGATKEDVIPVLQRAKQDFNGRWFNTKEYSEWRKVNGGPTTITIKKLFGTFEDALKKAGIEYRIFMYEGASHAFNNDSNPARYNEQAAKLAWERTITFFRDKLKG